MKVGILFGGPSRERNRSLPNARAVYAFLDRALFDAVPLWVDTQGQLYQVQPTALDASSVQDFFAGNAPQQDGVALAQEAPVEQPLENGRAYVGQQLAWEDLPGSVDFAWITIQGTFGEDGQLQEKLESLGMPYSGFSPAVCRYTADRTRLRGLLDLHDFSTMPALTVDKSEWPGRHPENLHKQVKEQLQFPVQICPGDIPTIAGTTLLEQPDDLERFELAVEPDLELVTHEQDPGEYLVASILAPRP